MMMRIQGANAAPTRYSGEKTAEITIRDREKKVFRPETSNRSPMKRMNEMIKILEQPQDKFVPNVKSISNLKPVIDSGDGVLLATIRLWIQSKKQKEDSKLELITENLQRMLDDERGFIKPDYQHPDIKELSAMLTKEGGYSNTCQLKSDRATIPIPETKQKAPKPRYGKLRSQEQTIIEDPSHLIKEPSSWMHDQPPSSRIRLSVLADDNIAECQFDPPNPLDFAQDSDRILAENRRIMRDSSLISQGLKLPATTQISTHIV